jgi:hypothetical protein
MTMADESDVSIADTTQGLEDVPPQEHVSQERKKTNWVTKTRKILLVFGVLYVGAVVLLCTPFFQTQ